MGRVRAHARESLVVALLVASLGLSVIDHGEARTAQQRGNTAIERLQQDEGAARAEGEHTRRVQRAGEPTGVCLREATKAALPILVDGAKSLEAQESKAPAAARAQVQLFVDLARGVERPLREYVKLQESRYAGVSCPVPKS
jgi:hypothetical protein